MAACNLRGRRVGRPRTGGVESTRASNWGASCTLTTVSRTTSELPSASTTSRRLLPCVERCAGLGSVCAPLLCRACAMHGPMRVPQVRLSPPSQPRREQRVQGACWLPVAYRTPTNHARHSEDLARELLPLDASANDEHDIAPKGPLISRRPAGLRPWRVFCQHRLVLHPQGVWNELPSHPPTLTSTKASAAFYSRILIELC